MSTLRKRRQRTFVPADRGSPGSPAGVRCPPAPPGYYYAVVGGVYRLVSGYSPQPNAPNDYGACFTGAYVWVCAPTCLYVPVRRAC